MRYGFPKVAYMAIAAVAISGALVGLDILVDSEPSTAGESMIDMAEKLILVCAMMAAARVVVRLDNVENDAADMRRDLDGARRDGEAWRNQSKRLMSGLSDAIGQQFGTWRLTPAESDIAGLMLKGMSLKDISVSRETSEATIRQQAQGIYRKSGLRNRAELSAYFLEDLFEIAEDTLPNSPQVDSARSVSLN